MIITYLLTGLVLAIALLVQGHTSTDAIRFFGVKPDLVFIIVVYLGYTFGSFYAQISAFVSGIFRDSISNSPLGFLTLPAVIIAFLAGMLGRGVFKSSLLMISLMLFVASLLKGVICLVLAYIFSAGDAVSIYNLILPEALYNAVLAPPVFILLDKLFSSEIERGDFQ